MASQPRHRYVTAAAVALAVVTLAACTGGGADNAASAGGTGAEAPKDGSSLQEGGGAGDVSTGRTAARVLPADRDVIYRGSITVRVRHVGRAADRAESLALGADGVVFAEQTSTDPRHPGRGQARLTLRVPPAAFASTLDGLARLGKELDRQRSAEDVTTQVTDLDSRVKSQQRSVDRIRTLLGQADTIGEVVQVEAELARREADLESLEAQLARMRDLTDLATIEVTFVSPDRQPPPPEDEEDLGFLAGLRGGWDAFVAIVLVALTVLGALVPFAVAGALVAVPLVLVWRARRRTPDAAPPSPADA